MKLNNCTKGEVVALLLAILLLVSVVVGQEFGWQMWNIYLTTGLCGGTIGALVATHKNKYE